MSRNYSLYFYDILESCKRITQYVSGMTFETFSADEKTVDAVVRNLEIIGEAVKSIPPHYFKVDLEVVWDIAQRRINELETAVSSLLSDYKPPETE